MNLYKNKLPKHVAFIMDGNRRYAKKRGLNSFSGHAKGVDRIEPIIDKAIKLSIPYLTFWAFSTENWHRSKKEVYFLLNLFRKQLENKVDSFHRKNVKLVIIGNLNQFPKDIVEKSKKWMETTKNNKTITVNIALSYGGRDEIVRAANKFYTANSNLKGHNIKVEDISNWLDTSGQPDPDLLVRTGGEMRLSGFMLWQIEYTELYFSNKLWPEFTSEDFEQALLEYQKRQRRFGR